MASQMSDVSSMPHMEENVPTMASQMSHASSLPHMEENVAAPSADDREEEIAAPSEQNVAKTIMSTNSQIAPTTWGDDSVENINPTVLKDLEDEVDSIIGGTQEEDGPGPTPGPSAQQDSLHSQYEYDMTHVERGLFVIINNTQFDESTGLHNRPGSDIDYITFNKRFTELGFKVHSFKNRTGAEIKHIMSQASKYDHSNADAFGCAIMSHGDKGGVVFGTDGGKVLVDKLAVDFKGSKNHCPSLKGKPKLFFIVACRGDQHDYGTETDGLPQGNNKPPPPADNIPALADFFFAYSTAPGHFSFRNQVNGTWFVQALNRVLEEHGHDRDLMWMMTRVNAIMASKVTQLKNDKDPIHLRNKKSIASIVTQLTKDVYFRTKDPN